MGSVTLFSNQTGDATSSVTGRVRQIPGNNKTEQLLVTAYGTWNDAYAYIAISEDGSTFLPLQDYQTVIVGLFVSDGANLLTVPAGCYFKAVIGGSGSPSPSLTVKVSGDVLKI